MPNTYRCNDCCKEFGAWIPYGVSKVKGCPYCESEDFELVSTSRPVPPGMKWAEVEKIKED